MTARILSKKGVPTMEWGIDYRAVLYFTALLWTRVEMRSSRLTLVAVLVAAGLGILRRLREKITQQNNPGLNHTSSSGCRVCWPWSSEFTSGGRQRPKC